ncbi:MAG: fibrobacter succinogenes major paralogous domain-containing protein [Bacteroidales bacterium]|nr:fibrobacter succinogenes major paralogous domain-containing protein [Bacteroidales bacterium]
MEISAKTISLLTMCLITLFSNAQETLVAATDSTSAEADSVVTDEMTVTDIDGNTYKTVRIGDQVWMAENLRVTRYADGTPLRLVTRSRDWKKMMPTEKAFCWYSEDSAKYGRLYGAFYNWAGATRGEGCTRSKEINIQGVCPDGWHVPSDKDWKALEMFLGIGETEADAVKYRGSDEGSKLADFRTLWYDGKLKQNGAFGQSGFAAVPASFRYDKGQFSMPGYEAFWWTSAEFNPNFAWCRGLNYGYSTIFRYTNEKKYGFSVRCVKNE